MACWCSGRYLFGLVASMSFKCNIVHRLGRLDGSLEIDLI